MMDTVLMIVLIAAALFIIIAVLLQKTQEDGLSSTIAGGNTETFYGRDKAGRRDKILQKWTIVVGLIFAAAVLIVYVIQPDYAAVMRADYWKTLADYSSLVG